MWPEDPLGRRARELTRGIAFATRKYLPRRMSLKRIKQLQAWNKEIEELVKLHMEHADRTIDQFVKNATDLAMVMPRRKLVYDQATGRISGEPASVPGERG